MFKTRKLTLGPFGTNCYFIISEKTRNCYVVDPADNCGAITGFAESNGLTITGIILTHAHFDHISALEELRGPKIPVMLHEAENDILLNTDFNMLSIYKPGYCCKSGDVLLHDQDTIDLDGGMIRVMHTPGHTPGSCCYIYDDTVICGDTVFREGFGRYDFPGGDYGSLVDSIRKIARLEESFKLLPGHGPSTTVEHEKKFNILLQ